MKVLWQLRPKTLRLSSKIRSHGSFRYKLIWICASRYSKARKSLHFGLTEMLNTCSCILLVATALLSSLWPGEGLVGFLFL